MTAQDTAAIVKGIAPVILQVVSQAVAPLHVKIAALEAQLAGRALVDREALSREPTDDAVREEREAFVAHLLQNLLGVQQAKGTR